MKMVDGIQQVVAATGQALNNMRKVSGKTTDRNVMLYESLPPEAFDQMAQDYGPDQVLDYIRAMETKRIQETK